MDTNLYTMRRFVVRFFTVSIIFFLVIPFNGMTQNGGPYSQDIDRFSDFVQKQMEADRIPGLSVGFYKGDTMWTQGYGMTDLENEVEATPLSAYRLASVTKSMTAVAILQLQESGKLDIDDPVKKYVPYFPRKRWDISVRHLMGHLGGISHYKDYEKEGHIKEEKDTREALEIFDEFDLVAKPGTEYHYSSYGYNLLGAVIEGAAEQPYGQFLKQNIWKPLDMHHTWMDAPDRIIPNRVRGYRLVFGERQPSEYVNISSRFAAGGTRSTVVDMLRYARGLNRHKVLSARSTRMMETSMNAANGKRTDYGMGWHIQPVNGHFQAYHTGGQPETRTILMRFPTRDFAIALAYNLEGGSLRSIARHLYQLIMDEGWNVKPYTGNRYDDALVEGMWNIYNYGMAYYDYRDKPRNTDQQDMSKMFDFLNNTLHPEKIRNNFEEVSQKIELGRHPKARTAYVRIGSYMAHQLAQKYGVSHLEQYHRQGAPAFFRDYLALSQEEGNRWPMNQAMQEQINRYYRDWSNSWNDYTRGLYIGSWSDLSGILDRLQALAGEREIYPDYTSSLANALFERALEKEKALNQEAPQLMSLAREFIELYPESAIPYLTRGNLNILAGAPGKAKQWYRQAMDASVDRHVASAGILNHYARRLFESGRLDQAKMLVEVASDMFPGNGQLWDTRGDILRIRSQRAYQKALELNPTLEETREELKELKQ